jgi:hypothetical protein
MSHIVEVKTEIRDPVALRRACSVLKLPAPEHKTVRLFDSEATGFAVELPGWRYPVVCETDSGTVRYDNYGERWGARSCLDLLRQRYCVEKARIAARKRGHDVLEQSLEDGSIKLTVTMGGAA